MREIKVLIVDDSKVVQAALKAALRRSPDTHFRTVGVANDGKEALWLYKSAQPDVVTLDIEMPRMEGPEFLREIAPFEHKAKVIVISHTADGARALECLQLGAAGVVDKKNLTAENLVSQILSLVDPD